MPGRINRLQKDSSGPPRRHRRRTGGATGGSGSVQVEAAMLVPIKIQATASTLVYKMHDTTNQFEQTWHARHTQTLWLVTSSDLNGGKCWSFPETGRQEDGQFADILNRIRVAEHTDGDTELLQKRVVPRNSNQIPKNSVYIFALNDDVNEMNDHILDGIEGEEVVIDAIVRLVQKTKMLYELDPEKYSDCHIDQNDTTISSRIKTVMTCRNDGYDQFYDESIIGHGSLDYDPVIK